MKTKPRPAGRRLAQRTLCFLALAIIIPLLTTCDLLSVGLGSKVDISSPVLSITSPSNGQYENAAFSVTGTVSDDQGVKSVTVTITSRTGAFEAQTKEATVSGTAWSLALDAAALVPGAESEVDLLVTALDTSSKSTEQKVIVYLDDKAPSAKLSSPTEADLTSTSVVYNGSVQFRGSADTDVAELVIEAGGQTISNNSGSNANFKIQVDTGLFAAGTGGVTADASGVLLVPLTLWAKDTAGNKSVSFSGTLRVSQATDLPTVSFKSTGNEDLVDLSPTSQSLATNKNIFAHGDTILGTIADDDGLDFSSFVLTLTNTDGSGSYSFTKADGSLKLKALSTNEDPSRSTAITSASFSFVVPAALAQGYYLLSYSLKDSVDAKIQPLAASGLPAIAAATASLSGVYFVIDDGNPVTTITAPLAGSFNKTVVATGLAQGALGIKRVEYYVDTEPGTWTPVAGSDTATFSWSFALGGLADGSHKLVVRPVSTGNAVGAAVSLDFTIDTTPPTIQILYALPAATSASVVPTAFSSVSDLGVAGGERSSVNGRVRLKGFAGDARALQSVVYALTRTSDSHGMPGIAVDGSSNSAWSVDYDLSGEADGGRYVFSAVATDQAGNTTTVMRTLDLDSSSDLPWFNLSNMSKLVLDAAHAGSNLLVNDPRLSGTVYDDDWVDASSLEILLDADPATAPDSSWKAVTAVGQADGSATFSYGFSSDGVGSLALSEGRHYFSLRAKDKDGSEGRKHGLASVSGSLQKIHFAIDKNGPTLDITVSPTATLGAYTLAGTVSDANAVAKVETSQDGSSYAPVTAYTAGEAAWTTSGSLVGTSGTRQVYIKATDEFGNESTKKVDIILDKDAPTVVVSTPTAGACLSGATAPLSGTAVDNPGGSGVGSVEYAFMLGLASPGASDWKGASGSTSWSAVVDTTSLAEGSYRLYVRSSDKAGNVSSPLSVAILVDQALPGLSLDALGSTAFSSPPNLTGSATDAPDAALGGATNGIAAVQASLDDGSFSLPLSVSGALTSASSFSYTLGATAFSALADGSHLLYLRAVDKAGKTKDVSVSFIKDSTAPTASFANVSSEAVLQEEGPAASGSFYDANGVASWSYRLEKGSYTGSAWTYATVGGRDFADTLTAAPGHPASLSWSVSLPAALADQGRYRLTLRANDGAAPANVLSAATVEFFVDREAPDLGIDAIASPYARTSFSVGGAADDESGLASVKVQVDSRTSVAAASPSAWSVLLDVSTPQASGGLADGIHTVTVTATDRSGKTTTAATTFTKDSTAPSLSGIGVDKLISSAYVNGVVSLSGTASDALALDRLELAVTGTKPDGSAYSQVFTGLGPAAWLKSFDTATEFKDGSVVTAVATAWDRAGNSASSGTLTLSVDQSTDVPVIKPSNVSGDPASPTTLKLTTAVYGTVSDDDGISKFETSPDGSTWTQVALEGSSWSYAAAGPDGSQSLYFRVTDSAGTVFTSPRILKTPSPASYATPPLAFKVDTTPPALSSSVKIDSAAPYQDGDYLEVSSGQTYGGPSTGKIMVRIEALDANGIAGIVASVTGKDKTAPAVDKVVQSAATKTGTDGSYDVYTTASALDLTALVDGSLSLTVTATDGSGLTTTLTKSIIVDNTAPTLSFLTPSSFAVVNGDVTVKGLANDNLSGLAALRYKLGKNYASEPWTSLSGSLFSWQLEFTGSSKIDNYATTSYATEDAQGIWSFPIIIQAEDKAGNLYTTGPTDYVLRLDPGGDKPTVSLLYPTDSATPLGGSVRIYGTASDDDGVHKVYMQIDTNNDGAYTASDVEGGTDWYAGGLGREVSGTNNWSQTINSSGEFNPSGSSVRTINFRVRAQDTKNGVSGDIYGPWVASSISFDNDVPTIGSSLALYLDRDLVDGNGNETSYAKGMYIKGNWYLRGSVEDDSKIADILVSGALTGTLAAGANQKPAWFTKVSDARYDLAIPITTTAGEISTRDLTITAQDATSPQARETSLSLRFEVDNAPPTAGYTGDLPMVQSNGVYKLKGSADDASGSGISKVEVYLFRPGATSRFYKPTPSGGAATVTRLDSPGVSTAFSNETALYPPSSDYVLTIDYPGVETVDAQDADGYLEKLKQGSGTAYAWYMDINSLSIPDGPIQIHYVAYDMAGNATHYVESTSIQNNGPAVAAIVLGTDLDESGAVDSGETARYATTTASTATAFLVKAAPMSLYLEATAGNGALYYDLSVAGSSFARSGQLLRASEASGLDTISLDSADLALIGEGSKTFSFTVWDSTEETTHGVDSLSVSKSFSLTVKILDTSPPVSVVSPLYWSSSSDNSLYQATSANGHIEYGAVSGTYGALADSDPKVSGKISFKGTAYDDQRITGIYLAMDSFAFTGSSDTATVSGYSKVAGFSAGVWTSEGNLAANGWLFTVTGSTFDQTGHRITWQLDWDSSKLSGVAGTDKSLRIVTRDKGGNLSSTTLAASATESVNNVPSLRVDVVPYIGAVTTKIATLLSSDFVRSAKGRYPVFVQSTGTASYETIALSGFNLAPSGTGTTSTVRLSKDPDGYDTSYATLQGTGLAYSGSASPWTSLSVTVQATGSGYLTVISNGVPSLNNVNSNASAWNAEASATLASVADDRYLSLWDFNPLRSTVASASNAVYPSMAMAGNTPQFAYENNSAGYGLAYFYNGSTATEIYENWDLLTFTALALNSSNSRAALYDINVAWQGNAVAGDKGGIMVNFFNAPPDSAWGSTAQYYRDYNVWLDNLYKSASNNAVLDRYQFPSLGVVGNDSLTHTFYTVYDGIDDRIIFRYFRVGTNATSVAAGGSSHLLTDSTPVLYLNSGDLTQVNQNGTWPTYTDSGTNNQRFSTGNTSGVNSAGQSFGTGSGVGLYSAVAGVSTGATTARAVLAYYSANVLYYQYATNDANTAWSSPVALGTNVGGDYVSMVVDASSHVHIAYNDSYNGDVRYIYIPTYNVPATRTDVKVDSYLTVGEKLGLTVNSSGVPYITYRGLGNTAKVAWLGGLPGTAGVLSDGADGTGKLTGSWEVQVLPTKIVDSDSNRFSIGVGATNGLPVVGYANADSSKKGLEYLTGLAELSN